MTVLILLASSPALAHGDHDTGSVQGTARGRSWWLELVPRAAAVQQMEIDERQGLRFIRADGLPDHATGAFPNASNPNRIAAQSYFFRLPLMPAKTGRADLGDLDECNGREGLTAEFPQGTYHYVVTAQFPHVPRCFMSTADASFVKRGGPPGQPGRPPGPPPRR